MIAPKATWRLTKQIVELNGSSDKGEIAKFIEQMPIMDSKYIKNFLNINEPKIDLNREVTAPSGKKVMVKIAFGAEFFRPFF
jgi:DNA polymerase sigma